MTVLLHQLVANGAQRHASRPALACKGEELTYAALWHEVERMAAGFARLGLGRRERVAIYLEKRFETVIAMFAAAAAGAVFVPVNPVLKPRQVGYILRDCNVRLLVTSAARASELAGEIASATDLAWVVLVDQAGAGAESRPATLRWSDIPGVSGRN